MANRMNFFCLEILTLFLDIFPKQLIKWRSNALIVNNLRFFGNRLHARKNVNGIKIRSLFTDFLRFAVLIEKEVRKFVWKNKNNKNDKSTEMLNGLRILV